MSRFVFFVLCLVVLECTSSVQADDLGCYTPGSVAGIVIATVVVTLVMGGLAAAFIWYLWKQRKVGYGDNKSMEKPIVCPPMSPDKQMIARESNDYAFDNPYFKDDETDNANPDAAEKGEAGFRVDNGDITPTQNNKASNGTTGNHHKKSRPFSSLPFHAVFHPSGKKQQRATMDDTYISKHLERITVPLRGHDFTGLGFNICGNMRDGIFVKDVLHRGPASESGKIKAGDRIVGVTVSFAAMVYEDALTILSYASPYDVRLEIEKAPATSTVSLPPSSPKRLGASTSFRNNGQRRLFHPLYRSQSIDDLTQIGKDGFGVLNTSNSQRDSNSSATPKRSQSVEASNGGLKTRPPFIVKTDESKSSSTKGSRKSSTSSCGSSAKPVTPTEKSQPVLNEEPCAKKEIKSARYRTEQVNVKTEAPSKTIPPAKPARESHDDKHQSVDAKTAEAAPKTTTSAPSGEVLKPENSPADGQGILENEVDVTEKPTAPPRKSNTPKRRAPAPPPVPASKTETSVVVHQADDLQKQSTTKEEAPPQEVSEITLPPPICDIPLVTNDVLPESMDTFIVTHEIQMTPNNIPVFTSTEKMTDPGTGSSDTSSVASGDNSSTRMDKDEQNSSPGKRKAASLGDLTKLEHSVNKNTSISSAILERAVSMDLQQSMPGENLTKHKKILHAPAFEDDYLEDKEDLTDINNKGLKRWDNGLDKVFTKLPNGDTELNHELINEEDKSADPESKVKIDQVGIQSTFEIATHKETDSSPENNPIEIVTAPENNTPDVDSKFVSNNTPGVDSKSVSNNTETDASIGYKLSEDAIQPQINHTEIHIGSEINHFEIDNVKPKSVAECSTEKSASDLENDSPVAELPLLNLHDTSKLITSTPVKKIIEVKNLILDDDDEMDDVPYLASSEQQTCDVPSTKYTAKTSNNSSTLFSPVTISIPVIKPDLTQFEKLPSPPPASTHPGLEPAWRMAKTLTDDNTKTSLERISVQSLYKPIFTSKEINNIEEPVQQASTEKMVNGNESDASEHYSTAQENMSTSSFETSSLSVTLSTPVIKEVTKTPNTIAGFAKTLIIPSPNDVENLLSLADEPNTPPPVLEPPAKPVETE